MLVNQNIGVVNGKCHSSDKCRQVHIGENTEASKYEMGSGDNIITIKRVESEKDPRVFID